MTLPTHPSSIIEGQYRCVKFNAVDQDGARCRVKLNIIQGQRAARRPCRHTSCYAISWRKH
ncbi:hypothetical protein J4733_05910 [Klebsiella pneumoniae]|uniref:Uncharacterized protein n=1 Tax=Klebsiella pneumoniae TaxID=573 RepID=A0A939NNC6_KLEPN|nr:hypothetical protein [Klebsiella pneumoniae]